MLSHAATPFSPQKKKKKKTSKETKEQTLIRWQHVGQTHKRGELCEDWIYSYEQDSRNNVYHFYVSSITGNPIQCVPFACGLFKDRLHLYCLACGGENDAL